MSLLKLVVMLLLMAIAETAPQSASVGEPVSPDAIYEGWKQLEDSCPSISIRWLQAKSSPWTSLDGIEGSTNKITENEVEISGERIRLRSGDAPHHGIWRSIDQTSLEGTNAGFARVSIEKFRVSRLPGVDLAFSERVYSEGECFTLFVNAKGGISRGVKLKADEVLVKDVVDSPDRWLHPVVVGTRPLLFHQQFVAADQCEIPTTAVHVNSEPWIYFLATRKTNQLKAEYWLDPMMNFAVRRCRISLRGSFSEQIDLEYDLRDHRANLKSWNLINQVLPEERPQRFPGQDALFDSSRADFLEIKYSTPSQIAPPRLSPGAILVDLSRNAIHRIGEDGALAERLTAGDLLMESNREISSRWISWHNTLIAGGILVLVFILLVIRRSKRKASSQLPG